ncbi:MAG: hypothetical protein ACREAK_03215 [Nitrosarchaeum sp.]
MRVVFTIVIGLFVSMIFAPMLPAFAATVYSAGVSPPNTGVIGAHLVSPDPHPSVAGVGGSGLDDAAGSALNGVRTYIYDQGGAPDLADGIANRGDTGFAMMIWDMGTPFNSMRLYTHQDHYGGGPIIDNFVGQDVMEYSVWGSTDGDDFVLLSDVTGFNLNGDGPGLPTYTFAGTEPTIVYRGGSTEIGIANAYTRDYTFGSSYQYYGVRASSVSISIPQPASATIDADPEIDAVVGFNACPPGTVGDYPDCVPIDHVVGGTFIPIDSTSLLLAGAQTSASWLIPVVLSISGIGVFIVSRRSLNS